MELIDWLSKKAPFLLAYNLVGTVVVLLTVLSFSCPECRERPDCPKERKVVQPERHPVPALLNKTVTAQPSSDVFDRPFIVDGCVQDKEWGPIWKVTRTGKEYFVTKVVKRATDGDSPYDVGDLQDRAYVLSEGLVKVECP